MRDLTNMALFAAVVEQGSFSAAARELGMPKATLSRRIAALERELGVRLLHRTTRQLNLTDLGREFLLHCQTVREAASAAEQLTQRVQEKPRGRVRMSSPSALTQSLLTGLLPGFMATYPEVEVDLVMTNKPVNLLDKNIDIALRVRSEIADSSLIARPLVPSREALYTAPVLLERLGYPHRPGDLTTWPSLSMHFASGRYQWRCQGPGGEQLTVTHQPRLITDDLTLLREAARYGQGVVSLPEYLCHEDEQQGRLVRLLPDWQLPVGIVHLVYPYRRGLLPAVRVLIDYLVERMPAAANVAGLTGVNQP